DYDEKDRAVLSTHADQVGQVSLDFSTPGETQVTDSQGKVSTYTTEIRNGVALVTAIQGPGCSSCGRGDVSYRYNEQLQLTEITTQDGITKQYQYDEIGRTAEVTRQATGEAPQTLARYEYADNTALKPSAVIRPSINPQGEHRLDNRYNRQGQPTQLTERGYRPEADGSFSPIERTTPGLTTTQPATSSPSMAREKMSKTVSNSVTTINSGSSNSRPRTGAPSALLATMPTAAPNRSTAAVRPH
ncbi:MAG: RHS repeat domain-containing protein, partial [Candidatus Thiodiazotropha endolucinida]